MPQVGETAPDFRAKTDKGEVLNLKDLQGQKVVLYFYPKDETPGCTKEACSFRDSYSAVKDKGATILGVSVDSVESHQAFRDHHSLPFTLLADTDKEIVQKYGVWRERERDGVKSMGTARTTFIIDEQGKIAKVFEGVTPDNHAQEVLAAL